MVNVEQGVYPSYTPQLPKDLQSHIQFKYYQSGHMIYVHIPGLQKLHDNVAAFIVANASP